LADRVDHADGVFGYGGALAGQGLGGRGVRVDRVILAAPRPTGPALTDIVIISRAGRTFVTGPDVVRSVIGEQVDMTALGGPQTHSHGSGVAHIITGTECEADPLEAQSRKQG
jgi:acetyl-CoA/propionyl-CoA carboxylase carboxyl transferase subunit